MKWVRERPAGVYNGFPLTYCESGIHAEWLHKNWISPNNRYLWQRCLLRIKVYQRLYVTARVYPPLIEFRIEAFRKIIRVHLGYQFRNLRMFYVRIHESDPSPRPERGSITMTCASCDVWREMYEPPVCGLCRLSLLLQEEAA